MADYDRKGKLALKALAELLDSQVAEEIVDGPLVMNAKRYRYLVDPGKLVATAARLLAEVLGPAAETFAESARAAYLSGTIEARATLQGLLDDTRGLTAVLRELPYLRRVSYLEARVFEGMKGFLGDTASRLGAVMLEQMSEGKGSKAIQRELAKEFGLSRARAERIARTEVIGASRRGRIDEAQDTAERFGVEIGMMWYSALSETTRQSHAALHGKVLTPDEVKDFYEQDGNAINCKCSQVEVILKDGKPIQEKLVARETERRAAYLKSKEKAND